MAARLFAEFTSSFSIDYVIEFHDNEFTGAAQEIQVSGNGFDLNYSGQTDNIYSPIIGSSVNVGIINKGEIHLLEYIALLKQYQQDRFSVLIYREASAKNINNLINLSSSFESRVANDGGSVESPTCYKQDIIDLGNTFRYIPPIPETLFWAGIIVQDLIEIEDVSNPATFSVQATDGISKLGDTLCGTSFFRQFTNQFINALDQVGVLSLYGTTDPILSVSCNWWAEEMTYNADNNPLDEVFADFHAFDTIDEQGVYTNKNWFEILSQMCTIFGLRFYYANGKYRLEQLSIRDNATFVEHNYQKDKTKIDESVVSYEKTIDQLSGQARLAGNSFNFLPAVNDVSITLNQEPKAMKGVTWDNSNDPDLEVGLVSSALQNQLTFVFNHQIKLFLNVNVNQNNIFAKLKLNVELFDFDNNVTYYLKRTYSGTTPSTPAWTTTQSGSGYEILIGTFQEFSGQVTLGNSDVIQIVGPTTIVTPKIPTDGDMTMNWDFVGFVESNGSVRGLNIGNSSSYKMKLQSVDTSFGSIQNQTTRIRAVSPNADINGLLSYELPETSIFTGQGERGSLVNQYDVGGLLFKVPYSNWREGNSGSYIEIQKLICQELLKLMDAPIEKYVGGMYSIHNFNERLEFDGKEWIQLGGTFNANIDQWNGEWFAIAKAAITPTFDNSIFPVDDVVVGNVNGSTGGVSFDGIDVVNLDTNILDVTTTANVGGNIDVGGDGDFSGNLDVGSDLTANNVSATNAVTGDSVSATNSLSGGSLDVTNNAVVEGSISGNSISSTTSISTSTFSSSSNATIGGTLGVTGASTLSETSVGNFTTTGSVTTSINDVDASSGGSENQSLANHTNFINYSGGENGTYTINLPSAVDGALLRFKTDSTISANKNVHLSPQTGETIDGSTEPYQMDRSFDGITLMGHTFGGSTNWFVIQKKEK